MMVYLKFYIMIYNSGSIGEVKIYLKCFNRNQRKLR